MYYLSILIAITGTVIYQIATKTAPKRVNPFLLVACAYGFAATMCVILSFGWSRFDKSIEPFAFSAKNLFPALFIAVSAMLIEIGYLLIYRSGWSIAIAPAIIQAATISMVMLIGLLAFGDKLTLQRVLGLALCIAGIFLVVKK